MKIAVLVTTAGLALSAQAQIQVVLASQDHGATSPKAATPGLSGILNSNFGRVHRSPTTNQWSVVITTNNSNTAQDQVLVRGLGTTATFIAQDGITPTEGTEVVNFGTGIPEPRFNDAGQWAMFNRAAPTANLMDRIIRSSSGSVTTFARSEDVPPSLPFADLWGFGTANTPGFSSVDVASDGSVGFLASQLVPNDLGSREAIIRMTSPTSLTLLTRVGDAATMPTGQAGTPAPWSDIDNGNVRWSAAGTAYLCVGALQTTTDKDRVAVVSGVVVAQEGSILPGTAFSSPVASVVDTWMEPDGTWFLRGTNANGVGWVLRNGAVIAQTGQPITPGSTELWSSFTDFKGNNAGRYAVMGGTSNPDGLLNTVVVIDGTTVVVRESDPVDIDDNPNTPPTLFIGTLRDRCTFPDDGYFYFAPSLKTSATATSNTSGNRVSLLRVPVPSTGPVCDSIDYNNDGLFPDTADIDDFLSVFSGGPCSTGTCADIDFNNDGLFPDTLDIDSLLSVFSGGACL
ncbi:MAG: hypothetical protein U0637_00435 [Phycisphaerales bacterium]